MYQNPMKIIWFLQGIDVLEQEKILCFIVLQTKYYVSLCYNYDHIYIQGQKRLWSVNYPK